MGELETILQGKSLADYTNTRLRLALGAVLYTNTADMWHKYLTGLGYSGSVSAMLQKYYVDYAVPAQFQNYILAGAGIFNPTDFFTDGSLGYIYDNNDLSSFYLDSAGTTAATVNGLVGLQLDKSGNLALGAELLGTGATGIIGSATAASYNTGTGAGSVSRVDGSNQSFVTFTGLSSTAFYRVTIQNTGAQILSFRQGTYASTILGDIGVGTTVTFNCLATTGQLTLTMSPTAGTGTFTITAVKLLPGNHRYQTTTGSKPILRGTPVGSNLVTNGDFASGASWSAGSGWAIGSGVATATAATGFLSATLTTAVVASRIYRITYTIVTATAGSVRPNIGGIDGVSRSAAGTYTDYITAFNTGTFVMSPTTFSGSVDNIEVVDVSAGQVTAPYGLQHDGIDDFLTTASVDFTASDKATLVSGNRKLSDAATGVVASLGDVGVTNGSYEFRAPFTAGVANIGASMRGSGGVTSATYTTFTAPVSLVVSLAMDFALGAGTEISARANGVALTPSGTDSGTSNFANQPFYFGRRAGTSLPYNGLDFGGIFIGKTLTASQISSAERWTAIRTGVTI